MPGDRPLDQRNLLLYIVVPAGTIPVDAQAVLQCGVYGAAML